MLVISASLVGQLRAKTDAPMMECKKALLESKGDMERAEEILRVKLGSKASKAADRVTVEGVVAIKVQEKIGAIVEVNCETDFVTKNQSFLDFSNTLTGLIIDNNPKDIQELLEINIGNITVENFRKNLVGKIGENMSIRRFKRFETHNHLSYYLHNNKIGVLVEFEGNDKDLGKDIAMHIAAMKPASISPDNVPKDLIEKERTIAKLKAEESGKPPEIIEKMISGSVYKFLKEVSLLNQNFVKNEKLSVEQILNQKNLKINKFILFIVGEGLEKKQDDFAAEVAAQVAVAKNV